MMKGKATIGGLILLATLAACGKVGPLEPRAGQALPVKSYGQAEVPTPDKLMEPSEQTRPGRSDELLRRSERRNVDPFDLPPGSDVDAKTPTPPQTTPAKPG